MDFPKIKYRSGNQYFNLEKWMIFAFELGSIIRRKSKIETFNIYLSLPNTLLFSKFVIMGIFDQKLKEDVTEERLQELFSFLEYGDVVYYLDNDSWKKCSVLEIKRGLTSKDSVHLAILNNKKITHYIPSKQWKDHIIIANKRNETIVGARTIQQFKHLSQSNLKYIYSTSVLNTHQLINEPCTFIVGNRTEFNNTPNIDFYINQRIFKFKDFIYEEEQSHFQNIKWINKESIINLSENTVPITLFMGANKALSEMMKYNQLSSRIILDNRHDNWETSELLRLTIEQDIIQNKSFILSEEIYKELLEKNISIPEGVEFIAWK